MKVSSELIRSGGTEPEEVGAAAHHVSNNVDRVNRLIGDMLDLDRMESGRMSIRLADVDINDVVTDVITRAASGSAVIFEFKAEPDPPLPTLSSDRDPIVPGVSDLAYHAVKD